MCEGLLRLLLSPLAAKIFQLMSLCDGRFWRGICSALIYGRWEAACSLSR
jgi:hypothetical protein